MDLGLNGKYILVVGVYNGLMKAITQELAKEGARIILVTPQRLTLAKFVAGLGPETAEHAVLTHALVAGRLKNLFKRLDALYPQVDVIINGLDMEGYETQAHVPLDAWRKAMSQNLEVAIEINNHYIPRMKKNGWGRIVNISSGASMEHSGSLTYCASKAALTAYTRCMGRILAIEANDVVMSAVLPGAMLMEGGYWDKTMKKEPQKAKAFLVQSSPSGRFGLPHEVSPMVAMLCSTQATYCQGAIVPIDGGQARHYYGLKA